jgi:hypothetical protein
VLISKLSSSSSISIASIAEAKSCLARRSAEIPCLPAEARADEVQRPRLGTCTAPPYPSPDREECSTVPRSVRGRESDSSPPCDHSDVGNIPLSPDLACARRERRVIRPPPPRPDLGSRISAASRNDLATAGAVAVTRGPRGRSIQRDQLPCKSLHRVAVLPPNADP